LNEIASGVRSALKSWLAFGASITGNKPKSIASVRMSQSSETGQPQFPQSRMKVMLRPSSTEGKDNLIFDEDMGPEVSEVPSFRSLRAAKALARLNRGEQKQSRKVAEDVQKVKNSKKKESKTLI
jgi:hypothetical protein